MKLKKLTEEEKRVIIDKETEAPFSGEYNDFYKEGVYVCRQCEQPLFSSEAKFKSGCGWPSFDEYEGAVERIPDADGLRTEIVCSNCKGHLGHVFEGEGFTRKDTRHCVNSLSIKFVDS
jgi:peptide-methionine (R)-S-oxide reductase